MRCERTPEERINLSGSTGDDDAVVERAGQCVQQISAPDVNGRWDAVLAGEVSHAAVEDVPILRSPEHMLLEWIAVGDHRVFDPEAAQREHPVHPDLESGADRRDARCRVVDGYVDSSSLECECGAEAADAGTRHYDVHPPTVFLGHQLGRVNPVAVRLREQVQKRVSSRQLMKGRRDRTDQSASAAYSGYYTFCGGWFRIVRKLPLCGGFPGPLVPWEERSAAQK